jgi:hypothetical protein
MHRLADFISGFDRIKVVPYCASKQLYRLLKHLPVAPEKLDLAEIPSESAMHSASRFDTKSGFRTLMAEWGFPRGLCRLPRGVVAHSAAEAADAAIGFLSRGRASVCKPDIGAAGLGLVWLTPDGNPRARDIVDALTLTPAFGNDPIVVEEVITADPFIRADQRSPSVEASIDADGKVEITYVSGQLISESGEFEGVSINYFDLPKRAIEEMESAATHVGQKLWSMGYRGFFDIDFVLSADRTICAVEGNLRRTGGTHAHEAAIGLLGGRYTDTHVVWSRSDCVFPFAPAEPEDLLGRIRPLLIENRGCGSGILPSVMAGIETGRFGYVGFAASAVEQAQLEDELRTRVSTGERARK